MLPGGRGGEFIIVAAIALIVVGPKDLPKMLRQLGRFVGKMRAMADDFKASFEDMARQSELDELRKEVEAMRTQNAPSIFADVHNEVRALDSEVREHLSLDKPRPPVMTSIPEPTAAILSDPQMEGLPPKGAVPEAAPEPIATPPAKPRKPRAPKAVPEPVVAEEPATAETGKSKSTRARKANPEKAPQEQADS
jgi:sec-independent protein translocase protein TatB